MDDLTAVAEIERLLSDAPGTLQIISSEHNCGGGLAPDRPPFDAAACAACQWPLTDPRHWVCHPVVSLEGPDHNGLYRARASERCDAWVQTRGAALLKRLLEVENVPEHAIT